MPAAAAYTPVPDSFGSDIDSLWWWAAATHAAKREAALELGDADELEVDDFVEPAETQESWPGEALNLRNLLGNLAASQLAMEDWKAAQESAGGAFPRCCSKPQRQGTADGMCLAAALELDAMWQKARYRLGAAMEGCAEDELCGGPSRREAAAAKFRDAHGAFSGALKLSEGKDKAATKAMRRVEERLSAIGAASPR